MKKAILLIALFLCCTPVPGRAEDRPLPLHKKISVEKLILAENYESALQKCRARSKKSAKHSCIEQKKALFGKAFADLEQNPKAYFAAKERNATTEKSLQQTRKPIARQ